MTRSVAVLVCGYRYWQWWLVVVGVPLLIRCCCHYYRYDFHLHFRLYYRLVMWVQEGQQKKPGIITGPGKLLVGPMDNSYASKGAIRALADVRHAARWGAVAAAINLLPAFGVDPLMSPLREFLWFRRSDPEVWSERGKWEDVYANADEFALRGRALGASFRPGDSVVSGAVGAIGYYGDVVVLDVFGLVDREVAQRRQVQRTREGVLLRGRQKGLTLGPPDGRAERVGQRPARGRDVHRCWVRVALGG